MNYPEGLTANPGGANERRAPALPAGRIIAGPSSRATRASDRAIGIARLDSLFPRGAPLFLLALALAAAGVGLALGVRSVNVDSAQLILFTQEYLSGRKLFTGDLITFSHPSLFYLHAPAILAHRYFHVDTTTGWYLWLVAITIACAHVFARALPVSRYGQGLLFVSWAAIMLLMFDDFHIGQREFLFGMIWIAYLACRIRLSSYRNVVHDLLSGALLAAIVCAKPAYVIFTLLVEPFLLVTARSQTRLRPLLIFVGAGILLSAAFFASYSASDAMRVYEQINYYGTIGMRYKDTILFNVQSPLVIVCAAYYALVLVATRGRMLRNPFHVASLLTVLSGSIMSILSGFPRDYDFIPGTIATCASSLIVLLQVMRQGSGIGPRARLAAVAAWGAFLVSLSLANYHGLAREMLSSRHAYLGSVHGDPYYDWVNSSIPAHETVQPVALQYGLHHFDPVVSTVRLNRRPFGHFPIFEWPLRAAIASGSEAKIDGALKGFMETSDRMKADWLVMRRTMPDARAGNDFVEIVGARPAFADWLDKGFVRHPDVGPYVVFRRR